MSRVNTSYVIIHRFQWCLGYGRRCHMVSQVHTAAQHLTSFGYFHEVSI